MASEYHILNLGAGVQSTTLYLMFMQGVITPQIDYAIFADTGEEPEAVYRHLEWLQSLNGPCQPIELVQLDTRPDPRKAQLSINFAAECMGVCGV